MSYLKQVQRGIDYIEVNLDFDISLAMVFVWSNLVKGDPYFTLSQVALNDTIMIFAFAPLVALLLGIASIAVPWDTLFVSVLFYIVIPVIIAQLLRRQLLAKGRDGVQTGNGNNRTLFNGRVVTDLGFAVRLAGE